MLKCTSAAAQVWQRGRVGPAECGGVPLQFPQSPERASDPQTHPPTPGCSTPTSTDTEKGCSILIMHVEGPRVSSLVLTFNRFGKKWVYWGTRNFRLSRFRRRKRNSSCARKLSLNSSAGKRPKTSFHTTSQSTAAISPGWVQVQLYTTWNREQINRAQTHNLMRVPELSAPWLR